MFRHEAAGDLDAAIETAATAAAYGQRFGEPDLFALAVHAQGQMLIDRGSVSEGLRLLDEAMVCVTAGETSPIPSGIVYCGVIQGCQQAFEVARAGEWTEALTSWCDRQPDMVAFSGICRVHRAELFCLRGEWQDAIREATTASERSTADRYRPARAAAAYLRGEVHRLRGELAQAIDEFAEASRWGYEPQPGLALWTGAM
jgi:hypothetical protein